MGYNGGLAQGFMDEFQRKVTERAEAQKQAQALLDSQNILKVMQSQYPGSVTPQMAATVNPATIGAYSDMAKADNSRRVAEAQKTTSDLATQNDATAKQNSAEQRYEAITGKAAPAGLNASDLDALATLEATKQEKADTKAQTDKEKQISAIQGYSAEQQFAKDNGLSPLPDLKPEDINPAAVDYAKSMNKVRLDQKTDAEKTAKTAANDNKITSEVNSQIRDKLFNEFFPMLSSDNQYTAQDHPALIQTLLDPSDQKLYQYKLLQYTKAYEHGGMDELFAVPSEESTAPSPQQLPSEQNIGGSAIQPQTPTITAPKSMGMSAWTPAPKSNNSPVINGNPVWSKTDYTQPDSTSVLQTPDLQSFTQRFPPAQYKGRTASDPATGKKYISDGTQWKPL